MTNSTALLAKGNVSSAYARSLRRTSAGAKGRGHKVYGGPWPGVCDRAVQPEQRTPVRAPEQQTRLRTFQHAVDHALAASDLRMRGCKQAGRPEGETRRT